MAYSRLEDYGLIGNLETCPLVGRDGSIDWCCFPHIESSSVFAAILDDEAGGRFAVRPSDTFDSEQEYIERTNVLRTTFRTDDGVVTVTDFMPVIGEVHPTATANSVYRKVTCTTGTADLDVEFTPRFNYARAGTTVEQTEEGVVARGNGEQLYLWSTAALEARDVTAHASPTLQAGETVWFVLQYNDRKPTDSAACESLLEAVVDYWQEWSHTCTHPTNCIFDGPWHDHVVRAGLVLRLLMNPTTHAIAAAPTTSLPEEIGGVRNWDYRFCWIRDAAFTIQALYELGHTQEAKNGYDWCLTMCHKDDPGEIDHPLYGLHYHTNMEEQSLNHLEGYRGSKPVRIGNAAGDQRQLDTYGELVIAIYTATNYGADIGAGTWSVLRKMIDYVCEVWTQKDASIWEVRSDPAHNVYSKVMCWAAIDRGIEIATNDGFDAPLEAWREERCEIKKTVLDQGFSETRNAFVQSFETDALDAAALRIGTVGFLPFDDPRIQGTIDAVKSELATDDGLVRRYEDEDGLPGEEGNFLLCSFWLVDALALSGRTEEAREVFENVLEYTSPLGLLAEEVDPETGEQRGNFPQAFSHLGLINSALYLVRAETEGTTESIGIEPTAAYSTD